MPYQEYAESVAAINAGITYTIPIPATFSRWGAANELLISFSAAMAEEINVIIDGVSWGLYGAGGVIVITKDDKKWFKTLQLVNTSGTNTSNDEIKVLVRRVV